MKLFLAAPYSGLPSLLTALASQASFLHFFTKLVLAAPWSGLPSALTALLSQDCAIAALRAKQVIKAARMIRFIIVPPFDFCHRFTSRQPFCACCTRSNTSAKSFLRALFLLLYLPSNPHRRPVRERIRPACRQQAFWRSLVPFSVPVLSQAQWWSSLSRAYRPRLYISRHMPFQ